ncbi:MAG TPA: hypothetical protein VIA18_06475 [Polyangia bacterium]|nr:hypothetical protein [Polyangia bacterium]
MALGLGFVVSVVGVAGCGSGVTGASGAAACATAATCGILTGGISQCTESIAEVNDPAIAAQIKVSASQVNCMAAAGANCAKARACLDGNQTPMSCSGDSQACDGNVWTTCDAITGTNGNNGMRQFDCGAAGEKCITSNGTTDCGTGTCSPIGATCDKDILTTCDANGIQQTTDCSKIDSTCVVSAGVAHCRGKGTTCTAPSVLVNELRCDGKVLVSCLDGQEARQDCGEFNLGCFPTPAGVTISSFVCALGSDCNAASDSATCEGNVLHYCNNGRLDTFNCGGHGFTGCDATNGGRCTTATP